jgi:hypothetical protein
MQGKNVKMVVDVGVGVGVGVGAGVLLPLRITV